MQKLLLGNYQEVEAFNRAKKLHISSTARRAVFLVETRQARDEHALATIRNIFSARTRDFITSVDDSGIIVIRELSSTESDEDMEDIAFMLVDMLGTEAMTRPGFPTATQPMISSSFPMLIKKPKQPWRLARSFTQKKCFQLPQTWNRKTDLSASCICVRNVYPGGVWQRISGFPGQRNPCHYPHLL